MSKFKPDVKRILIHILFWICFVCFFGILWGSYEGKFVQEFSIIFTELPVRIIIVYLNLYFFIPRFLFPKKYLPYFSYLILSMILAGVAQRVIAYHLIYPVYFPDALKTGYLDWYKIIKYAVGLNTVLFFTTIVKILKGWYRDQQKSQELAKEKLEAELKLLKGQVHPHFLFNTLNNLYSLTLKKSDCAPEVVLKLSELMDYMLYDANANEVSLSKEVKYIKNYIALEKIRYGEKVEIQFNSRGALGNYKIAPLLLLPFIENSFKHGVSGEIDRAWISIDLQVKDNTLTYKVENSKSNSRTHTKREYAEGIGLKNLKKRLELTYPDYFDLKILEEENTYLAILKLNLLPLLENEKKEKTEQNVMV